MKKKFLCLLMSLTMIGCMSFMTACGNDEESSAEQTTQEEVTEETVHAADPMTDEELENDDSEGCIEDSEDLLY